MKSWRVRAVFGTTVLVLALGLVKRADPLEEGLAGRYFLTPDSSAPARVCVDAPPSTRQLEAAWNGRVPDVFGATWSGGLLILRGGRYTFATVSDDASHVYIDGQLVVDNGGAHGPLQRTGSVPLERGVHSVFIDYDQRGGGYALQLLWSREGGRLTRLPASALSARRVSLRRFLVSAVVWRAFSLSEWMWFATLAVLLGWAIAGRLRRLKQALQTAGAWSALKWILLGSLALDVAGIWWGLPGGWAPGELTPKTVLEGMARHFSGGWYDTYPPFHFYVLSAVFSPLLWLERHGWLDLSNSAGYTLLALLTRLVSVIGAAAAIVAACAVGARAFGRRPGLFAAATLALTTGFVFYSKTANTDMPYVVWFAISVAFYLRLLEGLRLRDFLAFAVTATLAVTSKDQAYGLYLLMPLPIVHRLWQANREANVSQPFLRALVDRRLVAAGIAAAVLFALCHNLPFNLDGFRDHVRYIVGPGSADYQVYDATFAGRMQLLGLTLRLVREAFGWPLFVAAIAGLVLAAIDRRLRKVTVWLAVPVVSYYLSFINVILYNYDRFVLPIGVVLALFAGLALDRVLRWAALSHRFRVGLVAVAFAYTLLYSATIDILMIADSRYAVERWLGDHVGRDDLVASTFASEYLPRLERFRHEEVRSIAALTERQPDFYVLNADYARAVPSDSPTGMLVAGLQQGTLGYSRVFAHRTPSPWPWLPGGHHDVVGPRHERRVATILRNINPTVEIFQRAPK